MGVFQFVPKMIQWYREGKFPVEKIIKYFEVSENVTFALLLK